MNRLNAFRNDSERFWNELKLLWYDFHCNYYSTYLVIHESMENNYIYSPFTCPVSSLKDEQIDDKQVVFRYIQYLVSFARFLYWRIIKLS